MKSESDFDNTIILNDEEGREIRFDFLDLISYKGDDYVVLTPDDQDSDVTEAVILKVEETDSNDEETYVGVEDDSVLKAVYKLFKKKNKGFKFLD